MLRESNPIDPANRPVVPAGGSFTPLVNLEPTIRTTDVVGTSNACTMQIRFTNTQITF